MLDLNYIKDNKERVKTAVQSRNIPVKVDVEALVSDYEVYLDLLKNVETHRALRNKLSEDISRLQGDERTKLIKEATTVKGELEAKEKELVELKKKIDDLLVHVPNVNSNEMPLGEGEQDNIVLKVWVPEKGYLPIKGVKADDVSYMPVKDFALKDHVELGQSLDVIDTEQSAKVSGSRFYYLKNEIVIVWDAITHILKRKLIESGFTPLIPPLLVKERSLFGTSHFPEGRDQVYKIDNGNTEDKVDLFLVGSSEPANFSYFMDKILEAKDLPKKIYAQTPCFRSEVGSWGKDVRGIKRAHQFEKLEINAVCTEDQSRQMFDNFLEINEWLLQELKLPYRVINKCSGDCGYSATYLQYDWDFWRPKEKEFMEGGTDTLTTDYQARRLGIRYKDGSKTKFAHTVNDTGVTARVLIALLENNQNKDGSVSVPQVLVPYTGFDKIIPK